MTPEVERNLNYTKDSAAKAGFGDFYHKAIEDGLKAGTKKEFPLEEYFKNYGSSHLMIWQPKVTEQETRPGFFNFNGYQAKLMVEGKEPVSQFIPFFKMNGMTAEQSYVALAGGTVLHTEWDRKNEESKNVFSKIDFAAKPSENGNHPVIKVNPDGLDLLALLSNEPIYAEQKEKDELIKKLQTGETIPVTFKKEVDGKIVPERGLLQLNLKDEKTMTMLAADRDGTVLRVHEQKVKEVSQTQGMFTGKDVKKKDLPEAIVKMLEAHKSGPRIPGKGQTAA